MVLPMITGLQHRWMRPNGAFITSSKRWSSAIIGQSSLFVEQGHGIRAPSLLMVSMSTHQGGNDEVQTHFEGRNNKNDHKSTKTISVASTGSQELKVKDRRKHKIALVAGFIGSRYYGLQMDPTCTDGSRFLPTIENELRLALLKGQYIKPENAIDLSKINWSRSSRTDKGVHANRVVFCGHLEMPIEDDAKLIVNPNQRNTNGNRNNNHGGKLSLSSSASWSVSSSSSSSSLSSSTSTADILQLHTLSSDKEVVTDPVRFPKVISTLNQYLPDDIRVFSATKVNNGFSAKDTCQWRGYDYYMPIEMLSSDTKITNLEQARKLVDKFNGFLHQMEGCHGFHNFHRLSEKELKKIGLKQKRDKKYAERSTRTPLNAAPTAREVSANSDSNEGNEPLSEIEVVDNEENDNGLSVDALETSSAGESEIEDIPGSTSVSNSNNPQQYSQRFFDDNWVEAPRETHIKTKCTIYRCRATLIQVPNSDKLMVKVNIIGHYFLLHQIRLMLGAAILCTTDVLPSFFIRLATIAPVAFRLPLVPAEGLVLSSAGFHNNKHGPDIAMSNETAAGPNKIVLMTADDYQHSENFLTNKIFPKVLEDWTHDNNSLLRQWSAYCSERFLPSPKTLQVWQNLLTTHEKAFQEYEQNRNERERNRISFQVRLFYKDIQKREEELENVKESIRTLQKEVEEEKALAALTGEKEINKSLENKKFKLGSLRTKFRQMTDPSDGKILLLRCEYPHRLYLPNTVATLICVNFQVAPSPLVSEALRALATKNILDLKDSALAVDDSGRVSSNIDYANPHYYVDLIEEEVNRLIKKRKDLPKELQNPKNWSGYEKLRLWTNSQHKHLFIG